MLVGKKIAQSFCQMSESLTAKEGLPLVERERQRMKRVGEHKMWGYIGSAWAPLRTLNQSSMERNCLSWKSLKREIVRGSCGFGCKGGENCC